jgi:hypothetical protein
MVLIMTSAGLKLAVAFTVVAGLGMGSALGVNDLRRRDQPTFHHLTGSMHVRMGPGLSWDTLRVLPPGSVFRMGPEDSAGWALLGDVTGRWMGYIYARHSRIAAGLPRGELGDTGSVRVVERVDALAAACGMDPTDAELLLRRTHGALRRAGHPRPAEMDVAARITEVRQAAPEISSCPDAARFLVLDP